MLGTDLGSQSFQAALCAAGLLLPGPLEARSFMGTAHLPAQPARPGAVQLGAVPGVSRRAPRGLPAPLPVAARFPSVLLWRCPVGLGAGMSHVSEHRGRGGAER